MPPLSAFAVSFIPKNCPTSGKSFLLKFQILNLLQSTATNDSALLSEINLEFHKLKIQLDSFSNPAGSSNSPAIMSTISPPPSVLTPRQMKRQLRASNFRARQKSDCFDPSISNKSSTSPRKHIPHPKYKSFFHYLDMVDAGIIKINDSQYSATTSVSVSNPSVVHVVSFSSPATTSLPRRPPASPFSKPVSTVTSISFPDILIKPCLSSNTNPIPVVESNSSVTIRCVSSSTSKCLSRRPPKSPVPVTIPKVHSVTLSNTFLRPCYATSNINFHTLPQFLTARRPLLPHLFVQPTIQLPKWSTQKSQLYHLFSENSFTSNGCMLNKNATYLMSISTPQSIKDYFHYCLFSKSLTFCKKI